MTASLSVTIAWSRTLNVNRSLQRLLWCSNGIHGFHWSCCALCPMISHNGYWCLILEVKMNKMNGLNTNNLMSANYVHRFHRDCIVLFVHVFDNTPVTMLSKWWRIVIKSAAYTWRDIAGSKSYHRNTRTKFRHGALVSFGMQLNEYAIWWKLHNRVESTRNWCVWLHANLRSKIGGDNSRCSNAQ